jgi:hypothetical protein
MRKILLFKQRPWGISRCIGSFIGTVGIHQYQFVPIENNRALAIARVIGQKRDEEGTKQIWEDIPEERQFEVALP